MLDEISTIPGVGIYFVVCYALAATFVVDVMGYTVQRWISSLSQRRTILKVAVALWSSSQGFICSPLVRQWFSTSVRVHVCVCAHTHAHTYTISHKISRSSKIKDPS